jgi:hypothetical protein
MDQPAMKSLRSSLTITAIVFASQSSYGVAIQNQPTDKSPGNQEQVEEALSILPRVGTNQTAVMPTQTKVSVAQQPGLSEGQDWLKVLHETLDEPTEPSTLAEGAFVLDRLGSIIRGPNELLIFVPDKATKLPGEGPVLLMPCHTLEQLEIEWTGQPVELSGEIFTYHSRNQLLISAYRIGVSHSAQVQSETEPMNQPAEPDNEPSSLEDDPDVRDLLDELEFNAEPTDSNRQATHENLEPAPSQTARRSQVTLATSTGGLEEGTLIMRRPSRMIRNGSGAWTIVFDNDDQNSADATPLIVEPCRMLMRMENIAMQTGDAGQLLVSGRVYTYKGSHYLLPTLMQRVRAQEINSLQ